MCGPFLMINYWHGTVRNNHNDVIVWSASSYVTDALFPIHFRRMNSLHLHTFISSVCCSTAFMKLAPASTATKLWRAAGLVCSWKTEFYDLIPDTIWRCWRQFQRDETSAETRMVSTKYSKLLSKLCIDLFGWLFSWFEWQKHKSVIHRRMSRLLTYLKYSPDLSFSKTFFSKIFLKLKRNEKTKTDEINLSLDYTTYASCMHNA